MLDRLRLIFFVLAAIVLLIVIGLELGTSFVPGSFDAATMRLQTGDTLKDSGLSADDQKSITEQTVQQAQNSEKPPGLAIPDMALLDGVLLFAVIIMGLALLAPERFMGRVQGLITVIFSIIVIIVAVILAIKAFVEVMIMVSLFLAAPFGTIAYLAIWGFFPTGTAAVLLSVSLILKLVFTVLLVLAQQRFLQNKGLVGIIITSLVCCFIIGFLHSFVPGFLASITDRIGAIVALILVVIWGIFLLIGGIVSTVKAVT
jgi:hypothetical protein